MIVLSLKERLLLNSHVMPSGCWEWNLTCFQKTGYGQITYKKNVYSTHRLAMHAFCDFDLKSKKLILHRCDNKICINPNHLYVGDRFDNAQDSIERGQQMRGSKHPQSKLDEDKVKIILNNLSCGESCRSLANKFNVDSSLISMIKRHKIWRHVKG